MAYRLLHGMHGRVVVSPRTRQETLVVRGRCGVDVLKIEFSVRVDLL